MKTMQSRLPDHSGGELLKPRFLALAAVAVLFLALVFSTLLIGLDAFEEFYAFTRAHEDWNLDEWALGVLASLVSVALIGLLVVLLMARAIIKSEADRHAIQLQLERSGNLAALGTMVAGTAHSINNHLMPVIALVDLVRSELPADSKHARDLDVVLTAARSAADIVTRMKTFAKTNHSVKGFCRIAPVTETALELALKVAPANAKVTRHLEPLPHQIAVAAAAWEVVILNLVNNAMDALDGAVGDITVSLTLAEIAPDLARRSKTRASQWVRLEVADTGKGMESKDLKRIFEPFFTTKPVGKGTGLGLAESVGIVENAGGLIEVKSKAGQGTQVIVWLPASDSAEFPELEITENAPNTIG